MPVDLASRPYYQNNGAMAAGTGKKGGKTRTSRPKKIRKTDGQVRSGKLRIGNDWNAITIIALSQTNPLKAIAELVENSIDAHAETITIVRGREQGELYLKIIDDGEGIPRNDQGLPDFRYVATHICDSIKKQLKEKGAKGLQGEFGIGLLSFWTVGEKLILTSAGADERVYQMEMSKGESGYSVTRRRTLFADRGTELVIRPVLPGIRTLNGERIQHYLASELRDRIRQSDVTITIKDRYSRKEYEVKPREFSGRLLPDIEMVETRKGDVLLEFYLNPQDQENTVGLYRSGTRVMPSITRLDYFANEPWSSGYLQGMIDAPFLSLTPGTRDGIIHDENLVILHEALRSIEVELTAFIDQEKRAEEEKASRNVLRSVQRALKEAFLKLPREDYDWFDIYTDSKKTGSRNRDGSIFAKQEETEGGEATEGFAAEAARRKEFFEFPGPLYRATISPASCVVKVRETRQLRCVARDKEKRTVEQGLDFSWGIREGEGRLEGVDREIVTFYAPDVPCVTVVHCFVNQGETVCAAESLVTVTETLMDRGTDIAKDSGKGLPGYTFIRAPGELWRSKYDEKRNLIIINNGHADYIYAAKKRSRKLKFICRLFAKEMVLNNFRGFSSNDLLERMIELSLYTEENLR